MTHWHLETRTLRLRSAAYATRAEAEAEQQFLEAALGPTYYVVACSDPQCHARDAAELAARDAAWEAGR